MRGITSCLFWLCVVATSACTPQSATGSNAPGGTGGTSSATGGAAGAAQGGSAGGGGSGGSATSSPIGADTTELLTVVSADWTSVPATLRQYKKNQQTGAWDPDGSAISVVLGKSGLGWGIGLQPATSDGGPVKHEGDGRSPAGIFTLGSAFGYAPPDQAAWIKMPYLQATNDLECVDDPSSIYYNQLVYRSTVSNVDWSSSEQMLRPDVLYRWGMFVNHNVGPAQPGGGSCIFLHIWSGLGSSTVGCTASDETQLKSVIGWLDPAAHPVLVQLPQPIYDAHHADWALP